MNQLEQAVLIAATDGGAPPLGLAVPDSAAVTAGNGAWLWDGLTATSWSHD